MKNGFTCQENHNELILQKMNLNLTEVVNHPNSFLKLCLWVVWQDLDGTKWVNVLSTVR